MAGTPHVIVRYEGRIWYVCVLVAFEQATKRERYHILLDHGLLSWWEAHEKVGELRDQKRGTTICPA